MPRLAVPAAVGHPAGTTHGGFIGQRPGFKRLLALALRVTATAAIARVELAPVRLKGREVPIYLVEPDGGHWCADPPALIQLQKKCRTTSLIGGGRNANC